MQTHHEWQQEVSSEANKRENLIAVHGIETVEAWEAGKTQRVGGRDANGYPFYAWANPNIPLAQQFPGCDVE